MMHWPSYLHRIRTLEIERVFRRCPHGVFPAGLELGAGDGYQSSLLERYVRRLTATDWDPRLLEKRQGATLDVLACDAERVGEKFGPATFDLVFSSNLLEHLEHPGEALRGIYAVLRDDGVTIHIVPGPFWKVCDVGLFWPAKMLTRLHRRARQETGGGEPAPPPLTNNPKTAGATRQCKFLPPPHGAYRGHLEELLAFRTFRWMKEFERAGFRVVRLQKGPACSGYGFGWERLRGVLERVGLTTEYAYIAVKRGRRSPYERYFSLDARGVAG